MTRASCLIPKRIMPTSTSTVPLVGNLVGDVLASGLLEGVTDFVGL
jgi:hypothetical protein